MLVKSGKNINIVHKCIKKIRDVRPRRKQGQQKLGQQKVVNSFTASWKHDNHMFIEKLSKNCTDSTMKLFLTIQTIQNVYQQSITFLSIWAIFGKGGIRQWNNSKKCLWGVPSVQNSFVRSNWYKRCHISVRVMYYIEWWLFFVSKNQLSWSYCCLTFMNKILHFIFNNLIKHFHHLYFLHKSRISVYLVKYTSNPNDTRHE